MSSPAPDPHTNSAANHSDAPKLIQPDNEIVQSGDDGTPKFGRLLIVLVLAVILIGVITYATEAYYS